MSTVERTTWEEHYRTGPTPWDTRITPPEVVQFWQEHTPPNGGLALDLGCGTATNVGYLAGLGLTVIGFDLAANALATGRDRLCAERPGLLGRTQLVQADVTRLPVCAAQACYILDIGCLHGIPAERRPAYVQGVVENLAPGGYYHLFAFDVSSDRPERGMGENEASERFAPTLEVIDILRGEPDRHPCRWYLLRRRMDS
jgi:SAM-dependent methyltransferase